MKKLQANPTTAETLEEKFDRGDDVLDYFNVREARVVVSRASKSTDKKSAIVRKRRAPRRAAVAETAPPYRKKR
ncbi:MAG: hypothetical protein QOE26_3255 [Verrucomicrobiota bacterium]|jgi:hypothetical protein